MIRRLPIRAKLTAGFAGAMVVVLALAGLFVYLKVRSDLTESLDEGLSARAEVVGALAAGGDAGTGSDLAGERLVEDEDGFVQLLGPDGGAVASTLATGAGSAISPEEAADAVAGPRFSERPVPGIDGEARVLARSVSTPQGRGTVVVGATTEDRSEALAGLTSAFAIGGPVAVLLASLLGYALAGRALAPVESMRRRAAEITLERDGERLPLAPADDEVRRLGETLNGMLDRIESSLERERAFVSDASHELRTPLANLRAELELANRRARSPDEMRAALLSAAEETDRLSQLAEDLLVIARADRGGLPIKRERVGLAELLERVRLRFAERAEAAGRTIEAGAPAGDTAELDPLRIEQALGNLVENALRHGDGGVRLAAEAPDGDLVFSVSDEGPGFPPGFAPRAFQRFSRAAEGRSGDGVGLGLAIVEAIAEAHGGGAEIAPGAGPPTTVRIRVAAGGSP